VLTNRTITIRPAQADDAQTIVAFNRAMAVETEHKELPAAVVLSGVTQALLDPSRALYFLAEVDGVVAGQTMITVEWSDWRNGFFWWIQSVYIHPQFRRSGVFRALHEHIRREARAHPDVCGLRLYVHNENTKAMETYRHLGMARTEYALFEEEWLARDTGAEQATRS
jgi:GNAT superfamily N-acetyltransferase